MTLRFRKIWLSLLFVCFSAVGNATEKSAEERKRHFMFIGQPNAKAWQWLIDNPQDRQQITGKSIERLGGKMLSYYFGLGNGRNYITVAMPDDAELVQAAYVLRLASGLLMNYQVVELISSNEMEGVLKRVEEVMAVDDIQKTNFEEKTNG